MPADLPEAVQAMDDFAERTGLTSDEPPRRYLWTDAFAVCDWLGLHEATSEARLLELAESLVEQVHGTLGRHRADDDRTGWISGLSEEEGARRPTAGGLRIGKPRNEREPEEPYDPRAEWDRDGQYFHYLTKWMWALARMWRVTGDAVYHRHAVDLARAACAGFMVEADGQRRLAWKMSIDLSRPLVPSSGHHDPLDGLVTTALVAAVAPDGAEPDVLEAEVRTLDALCRGRSWVTEDPLGIGGLLVAALRCGQLEELGHPAGARHRPVVRADAVSSLRAVVQSGALQGPPEARLAFRELGLAIGLRALTASQSGAGRAGEAPEDAPSGAGAEAMADRITAFWGRPASHRSPTWTDHLDISQVMWVTALHPGGFLSI